jgi:F0F1-type ATP synthase assembly protein I
VENDKSKIPWWQPGMVLFARLSGWIIGPVLIALFVGKWLDKKYNTAPWLFLLSVGLAFVLSMIGIVKDSMKEMKRIEEEEKKTASIKTTKDNNKS